MPYLLNVVYLLLVIVLSPYLLFTAVRKGKYRAGFAAKWFGQAPQRLGGRQCIWLHAVSVGEVNLLAPLLKQLIATYPQASFFISATSRTGYELAKQKYPHHHVFYAPLDFTWSVKRALRRVRPDLLILAELELWPNLVWSAKKSGAKVAIFNGRLSENSFRGYKRLRFFTQQVLRSVDLIAAQNEEYAERFIALGAQPENVIVTGSLKFDGAESNRANPRTTQLAKQAGITTHDLVLLAGSTQAPEEELALQTYLSLRAEHPDLRLILVPRHPERFDEVAELLERSGVAWQRRSLLGLHTNDRAARVLLVDVIGELGAWWGTAAIGFVGGSLLNKRGGQNMIEPAAYGAAVCFGPETRNFRDIVALLRQEQAVEVVNSGAELTAFVSRCLNEPTYATQLGKRARALVSLHSGATSRTLTALQPLLKTEAIPETLPARRAA